MSYSYWRGIDEKHCQCVQVARNLAAFRTVVIVSVQVTVFIVFVIASYVVQVEGRPRPIHRFTTTSCSLGVGDDTTDRLHEFDWVLSSTSTRCKLISRDTKPSFTYTTLTVLVESVNSDGSMQWGGLSGSATAPLLILTVWVKTKLIERQRSSNQQRSSLVHSLDPGLCGPLFTEP